ncbi:MAG: hypothetical protein L0958_05570 [Candidatus Mariimomonas ferrooxydans]
MRLIKKSKSVMPACPPQADESGILLGRKILEASLREESLRPDKPACGRQAGMTQHT